MLEVVPADVGGGKEEQGDSQRMDGLRKSLQPGEVFREGPPSK